MKDDQDKLTGKCQALEEELERVRYALENSQCQPNDYDGNGISETRCRNYAYIVENAPVAVMITDDQGLIEFVNPKFEEVTGYELHEVIGKDTNILKSGETDRESYDELWKTIITGKQWTGEFHNRRKDGKLFWERAIIAGIKNDLGNITHFIAIKEDITEVKEASEKLERERLKIIQQSKMVEMGLLTSGILHEVSNPITAIRGLICEIKHSCETVENHDALHEMVHQQLDLILAEVDRVTGITMDISEFAYSRDAEIELLDINAMVNTTCRLVQYDKRWLNINMRMVLNPELPAVYAIKDQIIQVLINLLSNAAHAVEQEAEKPSVIQVSTRYDDTNIHVIVKDNGCGITEQNLPIIFDNFFTSKAPGEGTGLGLALCKSIIDSHQGNIKIDSQVGTGTEVCISLPIETEQEI